MKLVYSYNPIDGVFEGLVRADESPLEPGVYLMPAHSTEEKPMNPKGVKRPFFDGNKWSLIEDYRGVTVYSKENGIPIVIDALGPIPSGYTEDARPTPDHVFDNSEKKWIASADLMKERLTRLALAKRAGLLQESDWSQLPDVHEDTRLKYLTYRQALRDITGQSGYPFYIEWPAIP